MVNEKRLGFWDSVAINVGIVIGVGIFRTPGAIAKFVDAPPLILLTWALGGLVALLGVLCYAELASCFPQTGGTYIYLREAFGRPAGFLFGWVEFAVMRPGSIAGVAYILTDYLGNFIPFAASHEKITAIFLILFFTWLNIRGLHVGTGVQNVLTSLKIVSILLMGGLIFYKLGLPAFHENVLTSVRGHAWAGIAPALIPVLWTYGGWHQSTFISGEFADTKKDLPRSLITGALIVMGLYLLLNAAYLCVMTPAQTAGTKAIASEIFSKLFGPAGKTAVTLAVLISAAGALNSTILTGGHIPFAVAGDYPKLSWFAKCDPRFQTPFCSLLANGIWAAALVVWGNFDQLLFFFAFANWLFFALAGVSVFILKKKARSPEGFNAVGYPWVPALFVLSSLLLCIITVFSEPSASLFGAFLTILGLPVYLLFRSKNSKV